MKKQRRLILGVALLAALPAGAWSQETIPFVPSPMVVVERMLELADIKSDDIVFDMGSGDGRILIEAAKKYGVRGVGVDIDVSLVEQARRNAAAAGVGHLVEFRAADGLTVDISSATVVMLYMFKWFNNELRPKLQRLKPGARVVAHDFDIDDWIPTKVEYIEPRESDLAEMPESRTLYLWIVNPQYAVP